jgi:hypothetical protein
LGQIACVALENRSGRAIGELNSVQQRPEIDGQSSRSKRRSHQRFGLVVALVVLKVRCAQCVDVPICEPHDLTFSEDDPPSVPYSTKKFSF